VRGCGYATKIGGDGVTAKLKCSHEFEARKHLESNMLQLRAAMAF
jgi:flagellar hook-length control protein FliK